MSVAHRVMDVRRVRLEPLTMHRAGDFLEAVGRSKQLHRHWVYPPATKEAFRSFVARFRDPSHVGFLVLTEGSELAGVVNASEIVRSCFQSAYLGYYGFAPFERQGYMTAGIAEALKALFGRHKLQRIEANIQPDNMASIRLVKRLGFRYEGLSPRYLKVGGRWRDHQRWALLAEEFRPPPRR